MAEQPHDLDAERSILGAVLMDFSCLPTVEDNITADDFYHTPHQFIFNAILDVKEAGQTADMVTLCARLKDLRKLETCGGRSYIVDILDQTPSSANVLNYCQVVKEKSLRRQILKKSFDLAAQSQDANNNVLEIIEQYQRGLGIEQPRRAHRFDIKEAIGSLQQKIGRGFPGIEPPYDLLRKTIRKFIPGTMIILGGYTSTGKSAVAVDLTARLYRRGNPSLAIFSTEMSKDQYLLRLLANETHLPTWVIRENKVLLDTHRAILAEAYRHFADKNIHIYDSLYQFSDICKTAAEIKLKGLDIVIIDYIQNVQCEGRTIYERMSSLATQIFALAKDLEVTVIVLSQINNESARDSDNPVIGYKGAGEIAAAADVGIWIEKDKKEDDLLSVKIRKNRDGRTMEGTLRYTHEYTRLEEVMEAGE
jgi:replicative DNA helicase